MQLSKKSIGTEKEKPQLITEIENDNSLKNRKITKRELTTLIRHQRFDLLRGYALNNSNPILREKAFQFLLKNNPFALLHYDYLKKHFYAIGIERNEKQQIYRAIYSIQRKLTKPEIKALTDSLRSWPATIHHSLLHHELLMVETLLKETYQASLTEKELREDLNCLLYILKDPRETAHHTLNKLAEKMLNELIDLDAERAN